MERPFESVASLRRETQRAKMSADIIARNHKQYKNWKKSIRNRMAENGYGGLAKRVQNLTDAQIDWLHYYTDFDALTSLFRYSRDLEEGHSNLLDDPATEMLDRLFDEANRSIPRTLKRDRIETGRNPRRKKK